VIGVLVQRPSVTALTALVASLLAGPVRAQPPARPAPPPLTRDVARRVADSLRATMLAVYVFPDTAKAMAAFVDRQLRAGAYDTIAKRQDLAQTLTRDLRRAHPDAHLRIGYDPEEAARAMDTTRRESRDRLPLDRRNNFFFHTARVLPGNIGYVEFSQFPDTNAESRRTVRAALQFVANTDALILDLRENRGGSAAMASEVAGYFVAGRAHWSDSYNRLTGRWTEGWIENRPEITGGTQLSMPIVVLTSGFTFSAAEGLAYGLKHQRGARIVGEHTGGGAHVLRRVPLGDGYLAFVPYIRSANVATHTDWEGTGVPVDVTVPAGDALLRARELLLHERLTPTSDSAAVRAADWAIAAARAESRPVAVPADLLASYAGRYEEYTFAVRDGLLYATNASRGAKSDLLVPVTTRRFLLDRESQVEFVRDATGTVGTVRVLWNDGWVDSIARTK
jgi:retinol-binding protein 3